MLKVIKAGVYDTIQDVGRLGYSIKGINPNGAMDRFALQLANALVLNNSKEATLEMHFPAPVLQFEKDTVIALTGANFSALINQTPLLPGKVAFIRRGDILSFTKKKWGERCYLTVKGGFDIPLWLDSKSTNTKIEMGGFAGRPLQRNDMIPYAEYSTFNSTQVSKWQVNSNEIYKHQEQIYLLNGPEWDWLDDDSKEKLKSSARSGKAHHPKILQRNYA